MIVRRCQITKGGNPFSRRGRRGRRTTAVNRIATRSNGQPSKKAGRRQPFPLCHGKQAQVAFRLLPVPVRSVPCRGLPPDAASCFHRRARMSRPLIPPGYMNDNVTGAPAFRPVTAQYRLWGVRAGSPLGDNGASGSLSVCRRHSATLTSRWTRSAYPSAGKNSMEASG